MEAAVFFTIDKLSSSTHYAVYPELMKGSLNKPMKKFKAYDCVGGVAVALVFVIVLFCQNVSFFIYRF